MNLTSPGKVFVDYISSETCLMFSSRSSWACGFGEEDHGGVTPFSSHCVILTAAVELALAEVGLGRGLHCHIVPRSPSSVMLSCEEGPMCTPHLGSGC